MNRLAAALAIAVFGSLAGTLGHVIDQHPQVQSVLTDAANDAEATSYFRALGLSCGVEAWDVKVMRDAGASAVNLAPLRTTIPALLGLPTSPGARTTPPQVYQLSGTRLIGYKLEADSDIHLVLQSTLGSHPTMIAEIPNPGCASGSRVLAQITQARADFVSEVGQPQTYFVNGNWPVTLAGQGFGDFQHGQRGVAPNAVELHPVVSFRRLK